MKTTVMLIAAVVLTAAGAAQARGGSHSGGSPSAGSYASPGAHSVSGYTTRTGTYVEPHRQTNPSNTRNDNWSTRGNVNPDTSKWGTKPRDGEQ